MATNDRVFHGSIGQAPLAIVEEVVMPTSARWLFPDHDAPFDVLERARPWLTEWSLNERGHVLQSVHTYVVRASGHTVVIDTGVGNDRNREGGTIAGWHMRDGPFLEDLRSVVATEEVDIVFNTHMHGDHVGWNTHRVGDAWLPTFPNARYMLVGAEWEFWKAEAERSEATRQLVEDSLQPLFDAGCVELVPADFRLSETVWLEPSHGHSPGHVNVRVSAPGGDAVFIGDVMHSPIQCADPAARPALDRPELATAAREARMTVLETYAGSGVHVYGAHFTPPGGGRIERDGEAFRFEALER